MKVQEIKVLVAPYTNEDLLAALRALAHIAPRRSARLMVRVSTTTDANEHDFSVAFSRNVSSTGMLLELQAEVSVGDALELHFFVPGHEAEVALQAHVVRVKDATDGKCTVAVRYEKTSEGTLQALESFVSHRRNPANAR